MPASLDAALDALWFPDTSLAQAELNARSLWGAISLPGEESATVRDTPAGNTRAFKIIERV